MGTVHDFKRRFTEEELNEAYDAGFFAVCDSWLAAISTEDHKTPKSFVEWFSETFEGRQMKVNRLAEINTVYEFANGMVVVFDDSGKQMPEFQGARGDVAERLIDVDFARVAFRSIDWKTGTILQPTLPDRIVRLRKERSKPKT